MSDQQVVKVVRPNSPRRWYTIEIYYPGRGWVEGWGYPAHRKVTSSLGFAISEAERFSERDNTKTRVVEEK